MKDLVILAADKDLEFALRGMLSRPEALGMRTVEEDIFVHPEHDPACVLRGVDFLDNLSGQYRYGLLIFDHEGSGKEATVPQELQESLNAEFVSSTWGNRARAIVLVPELEACIWSDSPHIDEVVGWKNRNPRLRSWLIELGEAAFSIEVRMELEDADACYLIEVSNDKERPNEFRFTKEELTGVFKPDIFANMRFLELSPDQMREPAFPGATVLGDSGENLPVVLEDICADPKRKEILVDWLSELTPMDVADFEFPRDPSGRVHLTLCEANGRKVSAYSASDGTLRFLAMLAVLLGENPRGLYFFEEIDTGIHPARQWLLLELIEKQAAKNNIQIMTTTHAPDLLTFVNDSTFENMSVVCRLEDSHDAIIRPVAELPNVRELRQDQGLGRLHESGWMENALFFTEDYHEPMRTT